MINTRSLANLICVLTICLPAARAQPADHFIDELRAGFSRINITPDQPVRLAGYGSRTGLSTGVHDSLYARIAAFKSGDARLVLVSADLLGYYGGSDTLLSRAIRSAHGLESNEIFLAAVHTHAAPSMVLDTESGHENNVAYVNQLKTRLVDAVGAALADLKPVVLDSGLGASPVGVNRRETIFNQDGMPEIRLGRNPAGIHDRDVQVISVSDTSGSLAGLLFDYAVHSTSLGPRNYLISGDVHGTAARFVEEYLGTTVLAFAGTSGDIDPWYRILPEFETENGWTPETILMGTMLGEEVVHVHRRTERLGQDVPIATLTETLDLPAKKVGAGDAPPEVKPVRALNIGVARIGEAAFVCLGGEMTTGIGLAIKQASPYERTFVFNHCNGAASYLTTPEMHLEGGYEVQTSPFAPGAADLLIDRVTRMLHEIY